MPALNVNILLHGLFFMTQEGNNLRAYAPNIPKHHFVGGIRGVRKELSSPPDNFPDFTGLGLRGKADPQTGRPAPDPANDVDGSIMQFSPNDVGGFNGLNDINPKTSQLIFKGSILLPWPMRIIGLRTGDISTTFRTKPGSIIAKHIVDNAGGKSSTSLGVVALLQYTLPALNSVGGLPRLNIHYYLQPCIQHKVSEVNDDLQLAQAAFKNPTGFDLKMLTGAQEPDPIPAGPNSNLGITLEDEQSLDEERAKSADVIDICRNDLQMVPANPGEAASPANCPIFLWGDEHASKNYMHAFHTLSGSHAHGHGSNKHAAVFCNAYRSYAWRAAYRKRSDCSA